jgi:predicted RNA-binding protein
MPLCESTVYLKGEEGEAAVMEEVASIRPVPGGWLLVNLFGEKKEIAGEIEEIDLMGHRIVIRPGPRGKA